MRLFEKLSDMGMERTERFFYMTPRAVEREIRAHFQARAQREFEQLRTAWWIGRYAAVGVNAPERYPPMPEKRQDRRGKMHDADMKEVMLSLAGRNVK